VEPSADAIRTQLERILASPQFAGSARISRFLRFIVERSLAGEAERLKEYVVGVEVFDRGSDYDPRADSIVRVEAGRLRAKLEEYYRGAGATDTVRIGLGKGGYAPSFQQLPVTALQPQPAAKPVQRRGLAFIAAAIAVAAVLLAALLFESQADRNSAGAGPVIAVLPFIPYGEDAAARALGERFTEGLTAELVRSGTLQVVPSVRTARYRDPLAIPDDAAQVLGADWLLRGRLTDEAGKLRIDAVLFNPARNRKPWAESFSGPVHELDQLQRRVAEAAAAAAMGQGAAR
jgi:TolB-like protein